MTKRILLVEDDQDIRESVKDVLEDEGYLITEAGNGRDALDQLRAAGPLPDLILLDLMMPVMSGAEFREQMVENQAWASIPVVILSADADARAKAQSLRAAAVIEKPVELRQLFQTIERTFKLGA